MATEWDRYPLDDSPNPVSRGSYTSTIPVDLCDEESLFVTARELSTENTASRAYLGCDPYIFLLSVVVTCSWKLGKISLDYSDAFDWATNQSPKQKAQLLRQLRAAYADARPLLLESEKELQEDDARFLFSGVRRSTPISTTRQPSRTCIQPRYSKFSGLGPPPPAFLSQYRQRTRSCVQLPGPFDECPHLFGHDLDSGLLYFGGP